MKQTEEKKAKHTERRTDEVQRESGRAAEAQHGAGPTERRDVRTPTSPRSGK
ncbi:MAG TPA: hypothetical protein VJM11_05420 [Nevskiaceae bacterium]|nr:hypothetical protein [Nevskiaceae bacterium]